MPAVHQSWRAGQGRVGVAPSVLGARPHPHIPAAPVSGRRTEWLRPDWPATGSTFPALPSSSLHDAACLHALTREGSGWARAAEVLPGGRSESVGLPWPFASGNLGTCPRGLCTAQRGGVRPEATQRGCLRCRAAGPWGSLALLLRVFATPVSSLLVWGHLGRVRPAPRHLHSRASTSRRAYGSGDGEWQQRAAGQGR